MSLGRRVIGLALLIALVRSIAYYNPLGLGSSIVMGFNSFLDAYGVPVLAFAIVAAIIALMLLCVRRIIKP